MQRAYAKFDESLNALRTHCKRAAEINFSTLSQGLLTARIKLIDNLFEKFQTACDEFKVLAYGVEIKPEAPEKDWLERVVRCSNSAEDTYLDIIEKLNNALQAFVRPSPTNTNGSTSSAFWKTPALDCEDFFGDYATWPAFRDSFQSTFILNPHLTNVQKLQHLRRKCKKDAYYIVAQFKLEEIFFEDAWKALTAEYENKRLLVNAHLKNIFSLQNCTSECASSIKNLYDTVNIGLSALKNYDVQTSDWDPILVYLISTKLPHETLGLWEQLLAKPQEIPSWAKLNEFLHSRFRQLSAIADSKSHKSNLAPVKVNRPSPSSVKHNVTSFHTQNSKSNQVSCKLCQQNHALFQCSRFQEKEVKARYKFAKENHFCINCLGHNHQLKDCPSKRTCSKCKKRHHTLLHFTYSTNPPSVVNSSDSSGILNHSQHIPVSLENPNHSQTSSVSSSQNSTAVHGYFAKQNSKILLATAIVKVSQNNNCSYIRALIDPGSDASFILESTVNQLNWCTKPCTANVIGMGSVQTATSSKLCSFTLFSKDPSDICLDVTALVMRKLTGDLPVQSVDVAHLIEFKNLTLADPEFYKSSRIEMVIGADLYPLIIQEGVRKGSSLSPIAQNTIFGWILSGPCITSSSYKTQTVISFFNEVQLDQRIEKFWELEEVPSEKVVTAEDSYCESYYQETTTRNPDGKYVVRLPFKPGFPVDVSLGKSRYIALRQFLRTENSLQKQPSLKIVYDEVMMEYLALNHMTTTDSNEILQYTTSEEVQNNPIIKAMSSYLPHHGVAKPDSVSTKWRVVYNASCPTSNGASLNDSLCIGPSLQQDLVLLLLRWRRYPYIFTADVTKMYRQIWIHPNDANFQRILYRTNLSEKIQDFKLLTVTFGVNCAPYLAIRTLLRLAEDEGSKYPIAANIVRNDFYMDDVLSGGYDLEEVKRAQQELSTLLASGGFPLKKWAANHPYLLQHIPIADHLRENLLSFDENSTIKALGIYWNSQNDSFTFKFKNFENSKPYTKRKLFSNISKLFDPAGWLAPILITAKIMIQNIWADKTGWDAEINPCRATEWLQFYQDLPSIEKIQIPRFLNYRPNFKIQYHGFCDASQKAMGAVVYMRVEDEQGNTFVNLVSAKTKVAPLKIVSIPRLELCGAVLLAKLLKYLMSGLNITDYEYYLWTDSTVVLAWLQKSPSCWKTFIANRVTKIINDVGNTQWRHIRSELNPADLASRGVKPSELLIDKMWWNGPQFLKEPKSCWPVNSYQPSDVDLEERSVNAFTIETQIHLNPLKDFSSFEKALRIYAYVFRFAKRTHPTTKNSVKFQTSNISSDEMNAVKTQLIRITQKIYYSKEYDLLKENKQLPSKCSLLSFNPFVDTKGVMRCNGRLARSSLPYKEKFPVLLPYMACFSKLFVRFLHKITIHGGNKLMLNLLRKEFWIPRVKNLIKSVNSQCKRCLLWRAKPENQIMSALPPERLTLTTPFAFRNCVGVDYAGPIKLKSRSGRINSSCIEKGYICLFICFATKAVHLEPVSSLSTEAYLAAFDRFVSRRGLCKIIFSDNGTNFVGANQELKRQLKQAIQKATQDTANFFTARGVTWHFIPPGTPHYGGLWEAGVKSLKHHLRRAMHDSIYTFEELATILAKIEACLNSRPLTPITDDPQEINVLTPGHFLIGDALLATPHEDLVDVAVGSLKR